LLQQVDLLTLAHFTFVEDQIKKQDPNKLKNQNRTIVGIEFLI